MGGQTQDTQRMHPIRVRGTEDASEQCQAYAATSLNASRKKGIRSSAVAVSAGSGAARTRRRLGRRMLQSKRYQCAAAVVGTDTHLRAKAGSPLAHSGQSATAGMWLAGFEPGAMGGQRYVV